MTKIVNLKNELRSPEVERFEKTYSERIGKATKLQDIPIKNFVDTTSGLLETKVMSLVLAGATDAAGFWPELIKTVQLTAPKQDVPIISMRDFKIRKGKMSLAQLEESGG